MKMIKFSNLEKACEDLSFKFEKSCGYTNIYTEESSFIICLNPFKIWDCNFNLTFNYLEAGIKATLIKAITRDYEEYLNGN